MRVADPAFSPRKPTDLVSWALKAELIREYPVNSSARSFTTLARKVRHDLPAGSNHLFDDRHVEWPNGIMAAACAQLPTGIR